MKGVVIIRDNAVAVIDNGGKLIEKKSVDNLPDGDGKINSFVMS